MRESKVLEALCEGKTVSIGGVLVRMVEGKIKSGDRYVAERNTGPRLLTAKRIVGPGEGPGGFGDWIDPEESAYNYDIPECVKVRIATPDEEKEYRKQEDIRLASDELAKGVSEEAVADLLCGAGGYSARQAVEIVRMAKESLAKKKSACFHLNKEGERKTPLVAVLCSHNTATFFCMGLTYSARFVILSRVVPLFFSSSSLKEKEMDAPRSCKCGKELLPAEVKIHSGLTPKQVFGCVDCGATLVIYDVFDVFGISGESDLAVWLNEWTEDGGAEEKLSVFLRRALQERRKKTMFSAGT